MLIPLIDFDPIRGIDFISVTRLHVMSLHKYLKEALWMESSNVFLVKGRLNEIHAG